MKKPKLVVGHLMNDQLLVKSVTMPKRITYSPFHHENPTTIRQLRGQKIERYRYRNIDGNSSSFTIF